MILRVQGRPVCNQYQDMVYQMSNKIETIRGISAP